MADLEMQAGSKTAKGSTSTQSFLQVSEVKEDVIVNKDGGMRAVVAVSSTNFVLKSQDEQNAILARYQGFLNALEFPIQILMQSRHMDIHSYLEKIRAMEMEQHNELLRMQTEEYVEYVSKLLEYGNIMNKTFYVVIPFHSGGPVEKAGFFSKVKNYVSPSGKIIHNKNQFMQDLEQINARVNRVEGELSSLGLRTMRLNTQELVELLFNSYNPGFQQKNTSALEISKLDLSK